MRAKTAGVDLPEHVQDHGAVRLRAELQPARPGSGSDSNSASSPGANARITTFSATGYRRRAHAVAR
jgi:hypothetical protein